MTNEFGAKIILAVGIVLLGMIFTTFIGKVLISVSIVFTAFWITFRYFGKR